MSRIRVVEDSSYRKLTANAIIAIDNSISVANIVVVVVIVVIVVVDVVVTVVFIVVILLLSFLSLMFSL